MASFTPASFRKTPAEAPILTQTIRIDFYPDSANPYEPAAMTWTVASKLIDPNVDATLEQVARLPATGTRCDPYRRSRGFQHEGKVPMQAVRDLSLAAEAIEAALIDKFKFDPNKFSIEEGLGCPGDPVRQ